VRTTQKELQIYILPLQFQDHRLLTELSKVLQKIFGIQVSLLNSPFSLEKGLDSVRNQYNSTWILSQILQKFSDKSGKVVVVTSVDLYIPVLTHVFGEAQLDGKAAVVSAHRLKDELYGLPENPQKLKERLEKEAVHELGHTFGIIHCKNPQCVMYTSTYAEEIDFKPKEFCKSCAEFLERKKAQSPP